MFYRRKVILAMLQVFGGELEKIRLQKLLFLFTQKQDKPEYEFIPYKYGCYSYSANADIVAMAAKGQVSEMPAHIRATDGADYYTALKEPDRKALTQVRFLYGSMDSDALMRHTYVHYPFFAINSLKAAAILSASEIERVNAARPAGAQTMLFTIGYEGVSLEHYLNKLLLHDIKLLVDVRRNPKSMKYGFSQKTLAKCCESLGIRYLHLPEVGIDSAQRQELHTQADYDRLFENYRQQLPGTMPTQNLILDLLLKNKRIALTCFEANICQCHRKHLAEALVKHPEFSFELKHI